jgi:hypothetical protein
MSVAPRCWWTKFGLMPMVSSGSGGIDGGNADAGSRRLRRFERGYGGYQLKPGPHRPLGVIFMRLRVAEVDKDTIAHVLRYEPAEAHGLGDAFLIGRYDLAQVLRVPCGFDSAVEPTRSENITVTWRRSARPLVASTVAEAGGAAISLLSARNAAIASRSLRRCPRAVTPSSFRSSAVRPERTVSSNSFSRNVASYFPRPRLRSQTTTSMVAALAPAGAHHLVGQSMCLGTASRPCWRDAQRRYGHACNTVT